MGGPRGRVSIVLPVLLALLALQAVMEPCEAASMVRAGEDQDKWWHNAVIYQIYPRSFKDSDGDGVGDLPGITSQLDYLKDIGVTAIWLSPFYPSPQADFGYDISDFKNVDPQYGTMTDFKNMVDGAHSRGMKVVVDLVPNHSSDEHEWFKQSSQSATGKYADYYVWHEGDPNNQVDGHNGPPNNWVSHFRFSAWKWHDTRKAYYLHQFVEKQPDLNYRNADVVAEMKSVFTFWMDNGVDGFRVDALPFLFETEDFSLNEDPLPNPPDGLDENDYDYYSHPYTMDMEETYDMLTQWRQVVDQYGDGKDRLIMTECYTTFDNTIKYYGTQDKPGAHFTFNFQLITQLSKASNATEFKSTIDQWMSAMDWRWPNWVIGNHDNKRVATRFPNMADSMNMISMTLPGAAMTYNGEEIGMSDAFISWEETKDPAAINAGKDRYLSVSRDPCRTPMQWDSSASAGFSTNLVTWMPANPNYWELNVKNQQDTEPSHLSVYKDLLKARTMPTMKGKANYETAVLNDNVLMIKRSLTGYETFVTLVNIGSWEEEIKVADIGEGSFKVYTASVSSRSKKGGMLGNALSLRPKSGVVLVETTGVSSTPASTRPSTAPTTPASQQTTPAGSQATRAALLLSLIAPALCLLI